MKKKAYVKPSIEAIEIGSAAILAGSGEQETTIDRGNDFGEGETPEKDDNGTFWGE